MTAVPVLRTERLVLRGWREDDLDPFAALNADPEVMAHFPSTIDRAASAAHIERIAAHFDRHGFGLWAVEVRGDTTFVGFIGLAVPAFEAHFTPCAEVGWRLARSAWGRGFASEGARAALAFGFEDGGLDEIVSFTTTTNLRSQAVMARIGMTHDPADDFDHPALVAGDPLRRHVLFRITKPEWLRTRS